MKYSIRRQMTVIFVGVLVFILGSLFVANSNFLEDYYVSHKEKELISTYDRINRMLANDSFDSTDMQNQIRRQTERGNIDLCAMNVDSSGNIQVTFITENEERSFLYFQMVRNFFAVTNNYDNGYRLGKITDPQNNTDYLEMSGFFDDGSFFTMRSPLASIRESAALANQFLIYLGVIGVVLGAVLIWLFSRKITKPLLELAQLSENMANLNFDAKYTSGGNDEIGILGENFNRMSRQLEQTISELKSANNQLQKDLEQKEKIEDMRNEFLGNVSHELKTPIALIQGYAEGLKEGVNDDPESREFYCDVIMDEASKMNMMVKNLLTLNQLEFGSDEVQFERFDITGLVQGVISSCEILIQQAGAAVDFVADGPIYVWADEFKTEQVVRNYLTNAIHHVENEKRIEVRIIRTDGKARVTVFNSGKPIPEEDVPKLWDKFYKVDKAHTREYGGNGIGLSIVKAIMESFHQKYGVNNFDNGVGFWFELDARAEEEYDGPGDGTETDGGTEDTLSQRIENVSTQ